MAEERIGLFAAIWRFFTFYKWRQSLKIARAADQQFTGSVSGISDAYDLQQDRMVTQFKGLREAIAQVEGVMEEKRDRLEKLNAREKELLGMREGALAMIEKEKSENKDYAAHQVAFERFDKEILETEEKQATLEGQISEAEKSMEQYMLQLREMQAEVEKMPQEKAEAIAEFVSNSKIIELNDRLLGLQTSLERGPLDAVRKANKELSAQAKISQKLAGADSRVADKQYQRAGQSSVTGGRLEELLASRKAEREKKNGGGVAVAEKTDDRPKI